VSQNPSGAPCLALESREDLGACDGECACTCRAGSRGAMCRISRPFSCRENGRPASAEARDGGVDDAYLVPPKLAKQTENDMVALARH
jgi:hypothetical protein